MKINKPNWTPLELNANNLRLEKLMDEIESHESECQCSLCMEFFALGELNSLFSESETISIYTDADAQADGILIDVSDLQVYFNGQIINRCTFGADEIINLFGREKELARTDLMFISLNSKKDREDASAWGIFEPSERFGDEKFWLVGNEINGYTLMLPSEY